MIEISNRRHFIESKLPSKFIKSSRPSGQVSILSLKRIKELSLRQQQKMHHLLSRQQSKIGPLNEQNHLLSIQTKKGLQTEKPSRQRVKQPIDVSLDRTRIKNVSSDKQSEAIRPKMTSFNHHEQQLPIIHPGNDWKAQGNLLRLPLALFKQVSHQQLVKRMKQKVFGEWTPDSERAY